MSHPAEQALVDALEQIVTASGPQGDNSFAAREVGGRLAKQKDLKQAFEPLAKPIKNGSGIWIVQACLELPADHPLHAAAAALVAKGAVPWAVYVAVGEGGPKRVVRNLILSKHTPVVYAFEDEPRVSLWSMETGEHLRDVKIPAKKGQAVLWHFTDLSDGTLRAMTPRGAVLQCKPGANEFTVVAELGQGSFATSGDLSRVVGTTDAEIVTKDDGEWITLAVHRIADKQKTEFQVPLSSTGSDWLTVGERYAVIPGMRFVPDGANGGDEHYKVAVYDFETGETKIHPIGGNVYATRGPTEGTATLTWSESVPMAAILDAANGTLTPTERDPDRQTGWVFGRGHMRKDGALVGGYVVDPDSNRTSGVFDPKTNRFALASEVPAASVRVLERFDPSRPAAPRVAKPSAVPLAWARTGAVLRYSIADFDAEDDWTFTIADATDGLKLHVVCEGAGEFDIAFGASALASASAFVSFSQGSTSEDTSKPVDKKLPPFLLSHAMFEKIAAGKKLAWKTEWTDKDTLEPDGRATAAVSVNGAEQVVAVVNAAGEEASIAVLDDSAWPLVVERTEGDCHVKLVSADLSNAKGDVAKPASAAAKPAKAAKPASSEGASPASAPTAASGADAGGWQRYEFNEEGSSKFWEVSLEGSTMNIRFGKIGTNGQAQTKSFASDEAARTERDKLVREKTKKGYRAAGG